MHKHTRVSIVNVYADLNVSGLSFSVKHQVLDLRSENMELFQVGKVSMYDEASTMITLAPVPEYPVHTQQPEDDEDENMDENEFLPPYTPDGTLEV